MIKKTFNDVECCAAQYKRIKYDQTKKSNQKSK